MTTQPGRPSLSDSPRITRFLGLLPIPAARGPKARRSVLRAPETRSASSCSSFQESGSFCRPLTLGRWLAVTPSLIGTMSDVGHERDGRSRPPPTPDGAVPPVIELRGIDKWFGEVHANRDVSLAIRPGTIHGIVGENGAGKSTLMGILYGYHLPDRGEILVRGQPTAIRSPQDALAAGIGMVHQHFMLVEPFTVLENVVLGVEGGFLLQGGPRARPGRAPPARPRVPPRGGPGRARRRPRRGPAPAGRDPEGALPGRRPPDPRRADRRPHAPGGGPPLPHPPRAPGRGQDRRPHHPQAPRDPRGHGRGDRDAPGAGRRDPPDRRDHVRAARRADGRAPGEPAASTRRPPDPGRRSSRWPTSRSRTRWAWSASRA